MSRLNSRLPPRKRNASANKPKPKVTAKRFRNAFRNAAVAAPRASAPPKPRAAEVARQRGAVSEVLRLPELGGVLQALGGAALASGVGAAAVRFGIHPYLATSVIGGLGAVVAWQADRRVIRDISIGAASAAGSQLVLLALNPRVADPVAEKPSPKPAATLAAAAAPALPAPKPRAADLGGLPPGMLDAALERARADLAVASDGYPPGYDPYPERHTHNREHTQLIVQ